MEYDVSVKITIQGVNEGLKAKKGTFLIDVYLEQSMTCGEKASYATSRK